ncbi:hypothetical protein ARSEF1564_001903 [Beauveria bassiana]
MAKPSTSKQGTRRAHSVGTLEEKNEHHSREAAHDAITGESLQMARLSSTSPGTLDHTPSHVRR